MTKNRTALKKTKTKQLGARKHPTASEHHGARERQEEPTVREQHAAREGRKELQ